MTAPTPTGTRKRRLRDRLPVRLRQHWKPVGALAVGLAVMVAFLGDVRISPYVTSASRVEDLEAGAVRKARVGLHRAERAEHGGGVQVALPR
ncbi:hypothetical protein AB0N18_35925, partial [Streptomyces griseoincarnatus]